MRDAKFGIGVAKIQQKRRERNWQVWHNFGILVLMLPKFKKREKMTFAEWIVEILFLVLLIYGWPRNRTHEFVF